MNALGCSNHAVIMTYYIRLLAASIACLTTLTSLTRVGRLTNLTRPTTVSARIGIVTNQLNETVHLFIPPFIIHPSTFI